MSRELVVCLIAVAVNLAGMLPIYCAMSFALARLARHGSGMLTVIALIVVTQLFWIAPALWIVGARGSGQAAAYALWFGNWLVAGFSVILFSKSLARVPLALGEAAQLDGLGAFGGWRHTVLPFVGRDLAIIAVFTVMATLLPFWGFINQPDASNIITIFERTPGPGQRIGTMLVISFLGAVPLVGILFAAKKRDD